jgi:hypothetical protein
MFKLKSTISIIGWLIVAILVFSACSTLNPTKIKASLGQEFTLTVGQTVVINGEKIQFKFDAVTADSRCPKGVTCIWAGEAKSLLIASSTQSSSISPVNLELTETGLSDGYSRYTWTNSWQNTQTTYIFNFRLEPYPEAGKEISQGDYRLKLQISK